MSDRIVLTYKPRNGPRRRVTFEPTDAVDDWEYGYLRIEEAYETVLDDWRETGREHVSEPEVRVQRDGVADAEEVAPDA